MPEEFENDSDDQRDYDRDRDPDWRDNQPSDFDFEYETSTNGVMDHDVLTATRVLSKDKDEEKENKIDDFERTPLGYADHTDIPKISTPKNSDDNKLSKVLYDDLNATVNSIKDSIEYAKNNGYNTLEIPKGLERAVDGLAIVDIFLFANDYMDDMKDGNYRGAFATSFNTGLGLGFSIIPGAGPFIALAFGYTSDKYDWGETVYDMIQEY